MDRLIAIEMLAAEEPSDTSFYNFAIPLFKDFANRLGMVVEGPTGSGSTTTYFARHKEGSTGFWIALLNHNGVRFILRDVATEKDFEPAERAALMLRGELERRGIKYTVRRQNTIFQM